MDCVNNNNDIIVYEKPNTIIGRKLKGPQNAVNVTSVITTIPVTRTYIPSDPE